MSPSTILHDEPATAFEEPLFKAKASIATQSLYTIKEEPIHIRRPIRVICLGAGYSGLMMGIIFSQRLQNGNAELVIYERNHDLGGTWLENRFGGDFIRYLLLLCPIELTHGLPGTRVASVIFLLTTMHTPSSPIPSGAITMLLQPRYMNT